MVAPPVRLKDVAARAGVSIKTVSNVVNDYEHVSETTRARVRAAIDDLNYMPNLAARNLRNQRSGLMALALPEISGPYYAEIAHLVVEAAAEHGFTVLIDQTGGVREREQRFVSGIRAQLIDALIFTPLALTADDLAARHDLQPLVLLGETVDDAALRGMFGGVVDQVSIDSRAAGRAATTHLVGLGRQRIAAIGAPSGPHPLMAHVRRLDGYRSALTAAGHALDESLIAGVTGYHPVEGNRAMRELLALAQPPDAVFCFNDMLALGAIRACHTAGLRIPDDVAVVGFDDIEVGRYTTPPLTTIAPDKRQIARLAVASALAQLGIEAAPRSTSVGFTLVVRESSAGVGQPPPSGPVAAPADIVT